MKSSLLWAVAITCFEPQCKVVFTKSARYPKFMDIETACRMPIWLSSLGFCCYFTGVCTDVSTVSSAPTGFLCLFSVAHATGWQPTRPMDRPGFPSIVSCSIQHSTVWYRHRFLDIAMFDVLQILNIDTASRTVLMSGEIKKEAATFGSPSLHRRWSWGGSWMLCIYAASPLQLFALLIHEVWAGTREWIWRGQTKLRDLRYFP